jgi:hypothetical protein
MGTPTYTPLANITLGSSASSVTFGSIPSSYRDLVVVVSANATANSTQLFARYNSDSSSSYPAQRMSGNGASTSAIFSTSPTYVPFTTIPRINTTGRYMGRLQVMDYSATDKHKTSLVRSDESEDGTEAWVSRWPSTSAINSILLYAPSNSFTAGSTFALYGIVA